MIIVASESKPFEYTPKGTPRRHVVLATYEEEIDAAYEAVDESSQTEVTAPARWGQAEIFAFLRTAITRVMKKTLEDDQDFFQYGCDRCVPSCSQRDPS
jgi:hypothetical protein